MKTFLSIMLATSALFAGSQAHATTAFSGTGDGFFISLGGNQTSKISIADAGQVDRVIFTLDLLMHTSPYDLSATVTHNGVTANLFSGIACCTALLGAYSFDSQATTALTDAGGFPFFTPGTYSFSYPTTGSSFIGGNTAGDWTLSIANKDNLGFGILGGWTVNGTSATRSAASAVPEPASWALIIVGFGAVGASMRRKRPQMQFAYSA